MPVLPLFNIKSLQNTISAFQQQLKQPSQQIQRKNPAISLLPYCSINPPIVEHARNILSDICSSIPEFEALTTKASGMERLNGLFSDFPQVLEEIADFWCEEYILD
ncbi:hypothetical protein K3495_g3549 [Podosphaera aphanis]|nr:hypothetical protein K3495_g3549 [Podosphaera aphanis]